MNKIRLHTLLICVAPIFFSMPAKVSAWSIFGPKTYQDCLLQELPKAKTKEAAEKIDLACMMKFSSNNNTPTREEKALEAKKRECGLTVPLYEWMAHPSHYSTQNVLSNLKNVSMSRDGDIRFQNNNDFTIKKIRIGWTKNGTCSLNPAQYEAVSDCRTGLYSTGVNANSFGALKCLDFYQVPESIRRLSFCTISFSPFDFNEVESDAVALAQRLGYCSK